MDVGHDKIEGLVFRATNLGLHSRRACGEFAAFYIYMVVPWCVWVFHDISWSILTCVCIAGKARRGCVDICMEILLEADLVVGRTCVLDTSILSGFSE